MIGLIDLQMKYLILFTAIALLGYPAIAGAKCATLEIFETAYKHLGKGKRILSMEYLQREGVTVAYFLEVGTEKLKEKNGMVITTDLDVLQSIPIGELTPFRYDPPRKMNVTRRDTDFFRMPVIEEDDYFEPKLEPAGTGQPM